MTNTSKTGFGIQIIAGAVLALGLMLTAYYGYQKFYVQDGPVAQQEQAHVNAPKDGDVAQPETAETAPVTLRFDVVRVEKDGSSVIAGSADPGAEVSILLDGTEIGRTTADGKGKFVALLSVPGSQSAQMLSLATQTPAGDAFTSNDSVILTPTTGSVPKQEVIASLQQPRIAESVVVESPSGETPEAVVNPVAVEEPQTPAKDTVAGDVTPVETVAGETSSVAGGVDDAEPANDSADTAAKAPAVLLANEDGVRVLQPSQAGPEAMSNVVIDSISYDAIGEVQLSGRGTEAEDSGFVRVYLDNKPVLTTRIQEDGAWNTALPNVDTGIYTLRIDQVDAEGTVTSRTETPFKRETAAVLQNAQSETKTSVTAITVQPGSTLWAIARERYGDGAMYVRVFEANRDNIRDADLIYPGQVFAVPQ